MNGQRFIVVDASVWVSRLVAQDDFHGKVKTWFETQRAQRVIFIAPAILLVEIAGAISRRTGDPLLAQQAIDTLKKLPDLRLVTMNQRLVVEAARLAGELALRGADAFYVAVASQLNLPLATLDIDQRSKAAAAIPILSIDPDNAGV